MKVLHINCNYITTELHQTMIEHLDKTGIENTVFVPTYDKSKSVIEVNSNVAVMECFNKWDRLNYFYKQKKILSGVQSIFRINEFDCIHAYTLFTDGNCAMEISRKYSIPYVVAIRNTDVNVFFKYMIHLRGLGIEIMKNASAIFFLSPQYKKKVFEKYIPNELQSDLMEKSYVIPNGIDDFWGDHLAPNKSNDHLQRIKDKHLKVIYAGRIDKNKNIRTTQKALEYLRDKGYKVDFTVVGKIVDEDEFQKIIADQSTIYIEAQPKEKLMNLYREHDIFVMPSFTETFGLVYAEAMSQGLPVVYTREEGFDGQFEEGVVGYSVNCNDAKEVASIIEKICDEYENISKRGVSFCHKFRWEDIVLKYYRHYTDMCSEKCGH